jgi:hypothetical protein
MGLNRRLERRLEVVLPLGRRPARPGRLHRRLRVISDQGTAMRLMGYDPGFIAKHAGGVARK